MKYLDKQFQSPANSKAYVENWERIFGECEPDLIISEQAPAPNHAEHGSSVLDHATKQPA